MAALLTTAVLGVWHTRGLPVTTLTVLLVMVMPVLLVMVMQSLVPVLLVVPLLRLLLLRLRQGMSCSAAVFDSSPHVPPGRAEKLPAPGLRWALSSGGSWSTAARVGVAAYRQTRKHFPQRSFCTPLRGGGSWAGTYSLSWHHWHCTGRTKDGEVQAMRHTQELPAENGLCASCQSEVVLHPAQQRARSCQELVAQHVALKAMPPQGAARQARE